MRRIIVCAATTIAFFALTHSALAVGVGIYVDGGGGQINWTGKIKESKISAGGGFIGAGMVVDTCVVREKVFNYRMNLGYNRLFSGFDINRINLINTFGFAAVRTNTIRFWLGPQFGIRYALGSYTYNSAHGLASTIFMGGFIPAAYRDMYVFSQAAPRSKTFRAGDIHVGFALGVNFNLAGSLTLSLEAGFKYGTYILTGKTTTTRTETSTTSSTQIRFTNSYYEGYATVGVMYRVNEQLPL